MPLNSTAGASVSYPRVYRASIGWRIFLFLCGASLAAGGLTGAWYLANATGNAAGRPWLIGLCLLFAGLGTYLLLSLSRSRVLLYPDRIEVEELTRTDVLSRDEIRGWRLLPTSPGTLLLLPKSPDRRPLKIALILKTDTEFEEWMDTLPCLDLVDQEKSDAEILGDPQLGPSPEARASTLIKARRLSRIGTGVTLAAMVWAWIFPQPYLLAIAVLIALPWVALAIMRRSRGLLRADQYPNDAHPTMALPLMFPGAVLMGRSLWDYNFVNPFAASWYAVAIAAILWWAIRSLDPTTRNKLGTNLAFAMFSIMYGFGAALQADTFLDRSPETEYSVHVERKRISTGKVTRYLIHVEPWTKSETAATEVQINRATYENIQKGDVVHLVVRNGALGAAWYSMRAWERGG